MDKKKTLATLAFCLSTSQVCVANDYVDLRTLQILEEEGISYEEFLLQNGTAETSAGNYSRHSISTGNYSRHSISNANYSRHSISAGNYSRHSISNANYSRHSISGGMPAMGESELVMPAPISSVRDDQEF